jgi:hypothetical protein
MTRGCSNTPPQQVTARSTALQPSGLNQPTHALMQISGQFSPSNLGAEGGTKRQVHPGHPPRNQCAQNFAE